MPTTVLAGADFTVTIGATAYTGQITSGSLNRSSNVTVTKVLGPATAYTQTDNEDSMSFSFLYDEESGLVDAAFTASEALSSVAVVVVGGGATFTMAAAYISGISVDYSAEGVATATLDVQGAIAMTDTV